MLRNQPSQVHKFAGRHAESQGFLPGLIILRDPVSLPGFKGDFKRLQTWIDIAYHDMNEGLRVFSAI